MGDDQGEQRIESPEVGVSPIALANYHEREIRASRSLAAQKRFERFMIEYNQRLRDDGSTPLLIIVWGPGIHIDSAVAEKRWQIKEALEAQGHAALFSEEIKEDEDLQEQFKKDEGLLLKALRQAQSADFLVVLLDERAVGVVTELHLCTRPDIAAKVFVLIPKTLEESFLKATIAQIKVGNGAICWYTSDQMRESYVLTTAIERVDAKRLQVAWQRAGVTI